ncbi:pre-mRNA-splicing factor 38B [Colletotrichum graminicola M1.001]|uniref:Pre-mRNA-splicing factor 38B n=1 Tax=Colletotrichum graminicola (strain M1.001 / M2 / FGSC 10212) TaxID=645133 RepID=E3QFE6_COLGM|nr:pre-mRNA-splicing factor 38B [Colletotrichum graminicola M1.001]EFQ29584.1 pre-mRNA-splicing factor 38B [Colletotrichum graminicola M1.001]
MPNDNLLTDEYVAELLAKEADDCSLKYSSMGMDAFRTDKKPANLPKPNTRFLRHIIKDTNTHNKNLLAKEAAESRARLKDLEHADEKERRRKAGPQDIRRRQMGDIKAILGDRKDTPESLFAVYYSNTATVEPRSAAPFKWERSGSGRRERERESAGGGGGGDMSDSDPLDDFIGPAPAQQVRSRGRGAAAGTSGIDKRFETDYDPKADVETAEDAAGAGDWDDAVEAFRDRQKWRQNQEQRMRAAGYSDETIKKWREGGEQRDERDVRWAKAGEKREWDRGKEEEGVSGLFSEFN